MHTHFVYLLCGMKNILRKDSKIQVSTIFDTTKLDFYPVEKSVETVYNYWMGRKLLVLWKPYSSFIFIVFTTFDAKFAGRREGGAVSCNQITGSEFFCADERI